MAASEKTRRDPRKRPTPVIAKVPPKAGADAPRPARDERHPSEHPPGKRPGGAGPMSKGKPPGKRPAGVGPMGKGKRPSGPLGKTMGHGTHAPGGRPPGRSGPPTRGTSVDEGPRFVGGARNEHGTRVARRVTCAQCGAVDHVAYAPKDASKALCRSCAMKVLEIYDAGVKVRMPTKPAVCNLCGAPFALPVAAEDDGDPLCKNCLLGFTTWQGSVDRPFEERQNTVLESRASGTVVRKKKPSSS